MSNTPVATAYTHAFIRSALPAGTRSLLEIGCGDGELAERLMRDGFDVAAVDSDPTSVAAAKTRGVEARVAEWPAGMDRGFDAILFTRSLHHIHDLQGAIVAAAVALRANGRVIVEDFRSEGGSERSRGWFEEIVRSLDAEGAFRDRSDVSDLLEKASPADHDHDLHPSSTIADALAKVGELRREDSAYYFRYLEPDLRCEEKAQELLEQELSLIASGTIDALGKRFVVTLQR